MLSGNAKSVKMVKI